MKKKLLLTTLLLILSACLCACAASSDNKAAESRESTVEKTSEQKNADLTNEKTNEKTKRIKITVGNRTMAAALENNASAAALWDLIGTNGLIVSGGNYGGFEKVCSLGATLEKNDTPITTRPGDIVLYQGNQICFYYAENRWDFTMLAHVEDLSNEEIREILSGPETEVKMEQMRLS